MTNISNSVKKNVGINRLDQITKLSKRTEVLRIEISSLEKQYPFLVGNGQNDISRKLNYLNASSYLAERVKWIERPDPPQSFKSCSEFHLN